VGGIYTVDPMPPPLANCERLVTIVLTLHYNEIDETARLFVISVHVSFIHKAFAANNNNNNGNSNKRNHCRFVYTNFTIGGKVAELWNFVNY